ncbi:hypothetical protein BD410DRAFT_794418 [Rickenella mellea]|uniref:Uncharacterized protein n=1 Tax=Rickenella mellea TaxID=50990 RepID=A0A4Y7PR62_9AGAM|nr:hypothetical protein BD410DRAFT_794418 [Rickenella mellea]
MGHHIASTYLEELRTRTLRCSKPRRISFDKISANDLLSCESNSLSIYGTLRPDLHQLNGGASTVSGTTNLINPVLSFTSSQFKIKLRFPLTFLQPNIGLGRFSEFTSSICLGINFRISRCANGGANCPYNLPHLTDHELLFSNRSDLCVCLFETLDSIIRFPVRHLNVRWTHIARWTPSSW